MSERRMLIVKVDVGKLPTERAIQYMTKVKERVQEWLEHGPDPLVVPLAWEFLWVDKNAENKVDVVRLGDDGLGMLDACPSCRTDTSDIEVIGPFQYHCHACSMKFWFKEIPDGE